MAHYFPLMLDLRGRPVLLIAGGPETEAKLRGLLKAQAQLTVLAPEDRWGLEALAKAGRLRWIPRSYREGDLEGFFLVVSHPADKAIHPRVKAEAEGQRVFLVAVDDPENASAILPAVLRRGELVELVEDERLDLENLATGAFHPLRGFMTREEALRVAHEMRLPTGEVWSLPILLQLPQRPGVGPGDRVVLVHQGETVALLEVAEAYTLDLRALARAVFGTESEAHPGVARLYAKGPYVLGGRVEVLKPRPRGLLEKTPEEVRAFFRERGWRKVVAFQTRNAPHRAHEYLIRLGLELADGVLVHPILGAKKADDFPTEVIVRAYQALLEGFLPKERVALFGLATPMRYAGPKEAVFHALVRKNFGATHFLVGRDHAGVGDFYDPYAAHRIFDELPPLGIEIIRVGAVFFCPLCGGMASERTCPEGHREKRSAVSMTQVRHLLREGREPPPELVRPELLPILREGLA